MNKKTFAVPQVFLASASIDKVPGGHSAGGGWNSIKPVPMSFEEWLQSRFVGDYDDDPGVDFKDYAKWFALAGFGTTLWESLNPGVVNDNETE